MNIEHDPQLQKLLLLSISANWKCNKIETKVHLNIGQLDFKPILYNVTHFICEITGPNMKHYRIHRIESNESDNISDNVCMYVSLSLNLCMSFDYSPSPPECKWIYSFQIRNTISHAWKSNIWRWSFIMCTFSFVYLPELFLRLVVHSILPFTVYGIQYDIWQPNDKLV